LWRPRKSSAPDSQTWSLYRSKENVVLIVGNLTNRKLIDHRRIDPNRRGATGPIERNAAREQRSAKQA
jgi:hypothetical protein